MFPRHISNIEELVTHPYVNPASSEKISLCTAVKKCGLLVAHPRNWNKRVWFKYAQYTSWHWFGVSQVTCRWSILESPKFAIFNFYFPHDRLASSSLFDWCNSSIWATICRSLVPCCCWPCQSSDHRKSGRSVLVKYTHYRTIWAHIAESSLWLFHGLPVVFKWVHARHCQPPDEKIQFSLPIRDISQSTFSMNVFPSFGLFVILPCRRQIFEQLGVRLKCLVIRLCFSLRAT